MQQTLGGEIGKIATRINDVAIGRRDAVTIPLEKITIPAGWNVRDWTSASNLASIDDLVNSIHVLGQLYPGRATWEDGKVVLRGGERRYRALCKMQAEGILAAGKPVKGMLLMQIDSKTTAAELIAMLRAEQDSKPFEMIEDAEVAARLRMEQKSDKEIGALLACGVAHVANLMILHAASDPLKGLIRADRVKASTVIEEIRAHGGEKATTRLLAAAARKERVRPKDLRESGARRLTKSAVEDVIATLRTIARSSTDETARTLAAGTLGKYDLQDTPPVVIQTNTAGAAKAA